MVGHSDQMIHLEYEVSGREVIEKYAHQVGFFLDFYMEPTDSGEYGKSVLGDDYQTYFGGTKPAIWRFIKH